MPNPATLVVRVYDEFCGKLLTGNLGQITRDGKKDHAESKRMYTDYKGFNGVDSIISGDCPDNADSPESALIGVSFT